MLNGSILAAGFFMNILMFIWVLCSLALILIILIQKGKGGGLSSAFGGGMAGNILGANTKKPLTWFTIGLVGVFLFLAVLLARFYPASGYETPSGPPPVSQPVNPQPTPPAGSSGLPTNAPTPPGRGALDMNSPG